MNVKKSLYLSFAAMLVLLGACSPDSHDLAGRDVTSADLAEGIAYSVSVDQSTNTVVLKSLMDTRYQVVWSHPQGRSQEKEVTLQIPFDGEYEVTFGVETRGGVVYGEPYKFSLANTNPDLLTDPLWAMLAGGIGQSKSWQLDVDASGTCKYFVGPLYFYGTECYWLPEHEVAKGEHGNMGDGHDCWNWNADWGGNGSWLFGSTGAIDYGTITFDLINGAHAVVVDNAHGTNKTGKFLIDPEAHTMTLTDVEFPHDPGRDAIVTKWGNIRIFTLTEHTMQLGVLRDNDPNEGPCYLVYNFITTEAYNNPSLFPTEGGSTGYEEKPVTQPTFPGLNELLTVTTFTSKSYKVSEDAPYDWMWWNGAVGAWESNGFSAISEYPTWAPIPAGYDEIALVLEGSGEADGEFTATQADGTEIAGKYTLEGNAITFDQEINFFTVSTNRVKPVELKGTTFYVLGIDSEEGILQLGIPDGKNANGEVNQYLVLNLVAQPIGGGESGPTKLLFDNSKFFYGDIEGNGNFRLELCNQYGFNGGQTYNDPPFNASKLKFKQELSITFTISGLGQLTAPATATIGCSIDWNFDGSADADDSGIKHVNASVTGDGTYTVKLQSTGNKYTAAELNVFVIDILAVAGKLDGHDAEYIQADGETGKCPNVDVTVTEMTVE